MKSAFFTFRNSISALFTVVFCSFFLLKCAGQPGIQENKYGLQLINTSEDYRKSIENKPEHALIDLQRIEPSLQFSFPYTTVNNFVGEILYPSISTSYLRKIAADKLQEAGQLFQKKGLGILIFDAYRPYAVTERMWEIVPDSRYAADPKFGSGHNRGISVDLTLIDLQTGKPLDMGTGFDNFSDTAHIHFTDLTMQVKANRKILQETMESVGFIVLDTEWWHFYLPNSKSYPLMNLSFPQIEDIIKAEN